MAEVVVDIKVADEEVSANATKAAAGMAKLAAQEELVKKTAAELKAKVSDVRKALALQASEEKAAALESQKAARAKAAEDKKVALEGEKAAKAAALESQKAAKAKAAEEKKAALDSQKAAKAKQDAEKKAALESQKRAKAAELAEKKRLGAIKAADQATLKNAKGVKNLLTGNILEAAEKFPLVAVAAAGIGLALIAAGAAATALLVKIGSLAKEAGLAKQSSQAMLDVLTGGRGAEALSLIDGLAEQLGIKFQTARDRFIKFRQEGADNKVSANLLKLTADLDAIDPSGRLAEEAIKKVLSHKDTKGALDIKLATLEMSKLAEQARITGDGTKSAAAKLATFTGAMNVLDNAKTKALEQIWTRIGPAVGEAASKIALFVDQFLKSAQGQKAIDALGKGVILLADVLATVVPIAGAVIEGIILGLDRAGKALAPIGDMFIGAFGGDKKAALEALTSAVAAFVEVTATAVAIAGGLAAGLFAIGAAVSSPMALISALRASLLDFGQAAGEAGYNIVAGLISGITNAAPQLYAKVSALAQGAWNSFKNTLGIASPSKQFQFGGDMMGLGVQKGFEKSAPDASQIAQTMIPEPQALTQGLASTGAFGGLPLPTSLPAAVGGSAGPGVAQAAATAGSGGATYNLSVTVNGGNAEENARSVRRELESMMSAMQISRGR